MAEASVSLKIRELMAREVLDSRGFPTVEAEIQVEDSNGKLWRASAIVPSGASTGEHEALELRDGDSKRYLGKGVKNAVQNITQKIRPAILNREFSRQTLLDDQLREVDDSANKSNLGANAILAVSLAFARVRPLAQELKTYESISEIYGSKGVTLPVPLMNIINGGKHADNILDIQEFMIVPAGFTSFKQALRAGAEVFHHLKKILKHKGLATSVGDEGGFAPDFEGSQPHEQALTAILQAVSDAGYKGGREFFLALDVAASELVEPKSSGARDEVSYLFEGKKRSSKELIELYAKWVETYPVISIEDGLSEHDWNGWTRLTRELGSGCQLVGDDIFVTNPSFLKKGIESNVGNSVLIKLNQIGTVTETLETMKMAEEAGYTSIASHRSGETEDTFIADLAVGTDCGQIKTGSLCRTDRIAKYNQLLRIEERLGKSAKYAGKAAFKGMS